MVVSDLYYQVAHLGFELSLESEDRFYYAANRAILQVNALRPMTAVCEVNHKTLQPAVAGSFAPTEVKDDLIYECASAKGYYFEMDGKGQVFIDEYTDGGWTTILTPTTVESNRPFKLSYGTIDAKGAVRIRFCSTGYAYSVRCVALYDRLYTDIKEDVPPYTEEMKYDISDMVNDFAALCTPPIKGNYYLMKDYRVENGRVIVLPRENTGVYHVMYRRKPTHLVNEGNAAKDDTDIGLDEDLCALLPNLIASYVWLEDEPEKASYYLTLYREQAANILADKKNLSPVSMRNDTGW
jgi:hypothetical protein